MTTSRLRSLAGWLTSHDRIVLAAIVAIGIALRVATYFDLAAFNPSFFRPALDSAVFLDWARDIAGGDVLGDRPFFLNPLYPYLISPLVALAPDDPLLLIRLVQGVLGIGTILLTAGATRRFLGPVHALGAAFLAAVYPLLLFYEQMLMIVTVAVFLNALTLFALARFSETRTVLRAAVAGLPLGLAVLARPNVGLFALLLPLWLLHLAPAKAKVRFAAVRTVALLAGIVVMVLPVTFRNFVVGDDFVPVTSSMGINLWQCNNPRAWDAGVMVSDEIRFNPLYVETDAILVAERGTGRALKPSEVSKYWQRRALRAMGGDPGRAAGFLTRKAIYFLNGYEAPSSIHYEMEKRETALLRLNPFGFWLLGPLALAGVVLCILRRRAALPLALLFLAYWVGLTIFFPLSHYRAPVLPAVFPLATLALGGLFGGRRTALPAGALVLAAALLANGTALASAVGFERLSGYAGEKVTWWVNRGYTRLGEGDLDGAAEAFTAAQAEDPASWTPWMGLGHLARARGNLDEEERCYREVLKRFPNNPVAVAGLGRVEFTRGRRAEGIALVERAVKADPRDPSLRAMLADLLMSSGRPADALAQLREQARLGRADPDNFARRVFCLGNLGQHRDGLRTADEGIRVFPNYPALHFGRAYMLRDLRAPVEQVRAAVRAGRDAGGRVPPDLAKFLE
jgi:tetratricopeptide (TPR) repeat protein